MNESQALGRDDMANQYYDVKQLLKDKPDARYYFLLSGRSRGKTYGVLQQSLEDVTAGEGLLAYVRRYDEEIKGRNLQELFSPQNIEEITEGKYNKISFWRGFFYFEKWENDDKGELRRTYKSPSPCGVALALNTWERNKGQDIGAAYNGFKNIILDEVITGMNYLSDEFQRFQQVVSSLVRDRYKKDTKIWFLANPLSKWCPYFPNLGITKEMIEKPNQRYEISYPNTDMKTIFEYIGSPAEESSTPNKVYKTFFAFPNSETKSKSITDGFWELDDSMQLPSQVYKNSEHKKKVLMYFGEQWIKGEIMRYTETGVYFVVWSPSRAPKKGEYYFILNAVPDKYAIVGTNTGHPYAELLNKIMRTNQVYYSDNTTADLFHGFIKESRKIVR